MRPDHKNTPQVAVALLRDRTKLVFAAGWILSRDEPNPGGKITPRAECLRVRDRGGNSTRPNDADPVDALQSRRMRQTLMRLQSKVSRDAERSYHR